MQPSQTMEKNRAAALTVALIKINQKKELDKKVFKIGQKSTKKMQSQIEKKKKVFSFIFHNNDFMYYLHIGSKHVISCCCVDYFIETSQRKTRGKTLCKKIHARTLEERVEVTFNEDFQPIGPSEKVVSELSLFLGTLARNSTFCPLRYTNWSGMPDDNKNRFWRYTNVCFYL